jgi:hypothetical protein
LLAGRVALARLDFPMALKATEGVKTTDAHMIRGRAFWYSGELERAADELEAMLHDPSVRDGWARDVAKLARRGQGRKPFNMTGGIIAAVEMPTAGPLLVVPCEIDGESVLTLVATGVGEVLIDSATRKEPSWVSMKFGDRVEMHDVPAIPYDLSALSKQLQAPIRALLGVNLLRRMHVTFDRRASQFIVRQSDPIVPSTASRVPLYYVRGGGMMMKVGLGKKGDVPTGVFVDTRSAFPVSLNDATWAAAGVPVSSLKSDPALPANYKAGVIPMLRIGSFDVPQVPGVQGAELDEIKQQLDVNFGGLLGAGFLQPFRITMGDEGRHLWVEADLPEQAAGPAAPAEDPGLKLNIPQAPPGATGAPTAAPPKGGPAKPPAKPAGPGAAPKAPKSPQ